MLTNLYVLPIGLDGRKQVRGFPGMVSGDRTHIDVIQTPTRKPEPERVTAVLGMLPCSQFGGLALFRQAQGKQG